MKTLYIMLLTTKLLIGQSINPTLIWNWDVGPNQLQDVKQWGNNFVISKYEYMDYMIPLASSKLGLFNDERQLIWWKILTDSTTYGIYNIVTTENYCFFILADSIFKVNKSADILKKIKIPSDHYAIKLIPGLNNEIIVAETAINLPLNKFYVYDENLTLLKVFEGVHPGGMLKVLQKQDYYYAASMRYGGGVNWNVSTNITKYDTTGNVIWNYYLPDMGSINLSIINNRIYFVANKLSQNYQPPFFIELLYGELDSQTGDTIWVKVWRADGYPPHIGTDAYQRDIFGSPDGGIIITGLATILGQNISNYNNNLHEGIVLGLDPSGELMWKIRGNIRSPHGYLSGFWDSNNYLVLFGNFAVPQQTYPRGRIQIFSIPGITQIQDELILSNQLNLFLSQNYPNPFNPSTKIKFSIPQKDSPFLGGVEGGLTTLKVYDILGREISTLVNEIKAPGTYEINFNASGLSSGVYYYQLISDGFVETKKMILIR